LKSFKKNEIKKMVFSALFIALGVLFPMLFHFQFLGESAGKLFLPMYIPVVICCFVCGVKYGVIAAVLTPLISSLTTGMPPIVPMAPVMIAEMTVYCVICGFLYKKANPHISLLAGIIAARLTSGALSFVVFGIPENADIFYSFLSAAVIVAWPGLLIQLALIPALISILEKTKVILD